MYHINDLLTFVVVAKTGGIVSAARSQGISAATVSHRIAKLEEVLSLRLFHSNSRSVHLTDEGAIFLERVDPLLAELREAEIEAGSDARQLRGSLRVTMSPWILARYILPLMDRFQRDHPDLNIEFLAVDRYVSLVEEGIDCAIRVGTLADSALKAKKLCSNHRILCASPNYCAAHGTPSTLEELQQVRWACLPWQTRLEFVDGTNRRAQFTMARKLSVSNSDMLTEAVVQGIGVPSNHALPFNANLKVGP